MREGRSEGGCENETHQVHVPVHNAYKLAVVSPYFAH